MDSCITSFFYIQQNVFWCTRIDACNYIVHWFSLLHCYWFYKCIKIDLFIMLLTSTCMPFSLLYTVLLSIILLPKYFPKWLFQFCSSQEEFLLFHILANTCVGWHWGLWLRLRGSPFYCLPHSLLGSATEHKIVFWSKGTVWVGKQALF